MQKDGIKDRKYQGVLYPDSESYCCDDVLNILKSTFPEFAYILHEEMTEQTIEENPIGDAAAEAGGEEQGNEVPAAPADGEGQEPQISEITGTVTVDNLWERPIMSTPLSQYTVTEGLLLLCFLLVLVRTLFRIWNN